MFKKLIFIFCSFVFFSNCEDKSTSLDNVIYTVASKYGECIDPVGNVPLKCLLVKENSDDNWSNFSASIEGFQYEEGFEYEILVARTSIKNPLQDGSSIKYKLLELISKTEKESDF